MPRALLSVYDKDGIVDFARTLTSLGWELVSSGGTAGVLADAGLDVIDVASITGYPAILGHRVVTLHPSVHGAILADVDDPQHQADLAEYAISPIELVVVGLYPFTDNPSIDLIDVGGPAMIRAAAKNYRHVGVITNRTQYAPVLDELASDGTLSLDTRQRLAREAFATTAAYDASIAEWFNDDAPLPDRITLSLTKEATLRYGENPHQVAARYAIEGTPSWWSSVEQLNGKALSYLNVVDAEAATDLVIQFDMPAAVIVKHANPCGVAIGATLVEAYSKALTCDPTSAFGGIVALNHTVDLATAEAITQVFTEVVIAPDFEEEARALLSRRENLRLLRASFPSADRHHVRHIHGGMLLQSPDQPKISTDSWRVVSTAQPTETQLQDAHLAWVVCGATWSNAIVLAKDSATVGIGGGQPNRLDAAALACRRAGERTRDAVAASDAFFPFADGPQHLFDHGVQVIVQPGGSTRDEESIAAANDAHRVMIFTGVRHFRH